MGEETAMERSKDAVFVFGPPRSGTSAVSHVLSELGVYFGRKERFVDAAVHTHNPVFFELAEVNRLNDRICRRLGGEYAEFGLVPTASSFDERVHGEFADEIRALVRAELGTGSLVGLKDPRFVVTLPLWQRALEEDGYRCRAVVTERHDAATERSNALVNAGFDEAHNRRIVQLSKLLAAWQAQRLPALAVDFDALVARPIEQVTRLGAFLGSDDASLGRAAAVLDDAHRHHAGVPVGDDSTDWLPKRATEYQALSETLQRTGLLDLMLQWRQGRGEALAAAAHAQERSVAAESELRECRGRLAATAEGHATLAALVPLVAEPRLPQSRLYIASDGSLAEEHALDGEVRAVGTGYVANFDVSAAQVGDLLRFDPDVVPGVYRLDGCQVGGKRLQRLRECVLAVGEAALHGDPLMIVAAGNDPWWQLALASDFRDDGAQQVVVSVEFTRISLMELAGRAAMVAELQPLRDVLAGLQAGVAGMHEGIAATVSAVSAQSRAQAEAAAAQVAAIDAKIVSLEHRMEESVAASVRSNGEVQAHIGGLASELASLRTMLESAAARDRETREKIGLVLSWAERRSPGYWWRRLTGRGGNRA